ncbi:MAG: DUF3794 domain-containing protein [Clostridia bacterium]|nr:DUF3794 domain-containing protein [Clostridia bacterium]
MMDFNVEKQSLSSCRVIREAKAEQSVDCDITLPDYCPDIKSVLCCEVEPGITAVDITGNRITAVGNATVKLIYVGDDDAISCFEQSCPINKYVEMSSLPEESTMLVSAKTSYVNCRAVSPRRMDVHGCITVLFSAVCRETAQVVSSASAQGIQLRQQPVQTCNSLGCTSKLFQMSEVIPLPEGTQNAKSILHADALPVITQTKNVSNKTLIKGDLQLAFTLCSQDGEVTKAEHTMPISQIAELQGLDENSLCDVRLSVSSLDVQLKPDESGEMRRIDVAAGICAVVRGYSKTAAVLLSDAFSTVNELELQKDSVCEEGLAAVLDETFVNSAELDFTGAAVGRVLDSWCTDLTCVHSFADSQLDLSGAVTVCVLYKDADDKPCFARRRVDYRHNIAVNSDTEDVNYEPNICVSGVAVSGKGTQLNARIQLNASGCVFSRKNHLAVTDITESGKKSKDNLSAITVYFADKGEKLWDIAKRFGTSVDAVSRRNSLSGEALHDDTMLIIPRS